MGLGELLDQVRAYYLDRFREAVEEQESKPETRVIVESAFLDSSGLPSREGVLNLPMRGDVLVVENGQVTGSHQVGAENMLGFEPIRFSWSE